MIWFLFSASWHCDVCDVYHPPPVISRSANFVERHVETKQAKGSSTNGTIEGFRIYCCCYDVQQHLYVED